MCLKEIYKLKQVEKKVVRQNVYEYDYQKKIYKIKRKKERKKKPNKTKAQTLTKMKNLQMLIFFPRWECIS